MFTHPLSTLDDGGPKRVGRHAYLLLGGSLCVHLQILADHIAMCQGRAHTLLHSIKIEIPPES